MSRDQPRRNVTWSNVSRATVHRLLPLAARRIRQRQGRRRVFSKRQRITLRLLYAIDRPSVVCLSVCLSVVCDVGAPYSGG